MEKEELELDGEKWQRFERHLRDAKQKTFDAHSAAKKDNANLKIAISAIQESVNRWKLFLDNTKLKMLQKKRHLFWYRIYAGVWKSWVTRSPTSVMVRLKIFYLLIRINIVSILVVIAVIVGVIIILSSLS